MSNRLQIKTAGLASIAAEANAPPSPYAAKQSVEPNVLREVRERMRRLQADHKAVLAENERLKAELSAVRAELKAAKHGRHGSASGDQELAPFLELLSSQKVRKASLSASTPAEATSKLVTDASFFVFGDAMEFIGMWRTLSGERGFVPPAELSQARGAARTPPRKSLCTPPRTPPLTPPLAV